MMMSSTWNIFCVTGPLWGEFTGHRWIPLTKGQWRGALMFSLICAWTNGWANHRDTITLIVTLLLYITSISPWTKWPPVRKSSKDYCWQQFLFCRHHFEINFSILLKQNITDSYNSLSPVGYQTIILTSVGLFFTLPMGTNFSGNWIKIQNILWRKCRWIGCLQNVSQFVQGALS